VSASMPSPVKLAWSLFAALCITGAVLLPWTIHFPGYFPILEVHRYLGYAVVVVGPLALAWHLVQTSSRGWMVGVAIVLGGIASIPVVGALDFPHPAGFLERQAEVVQALADDLADGMGVIEAIRDRVENRHLGGDRVGLNFDDLLGSLVLIFLLGASALFTFIGIVTRARQRAASRWSGTALTLLTAWALASGAVLHLQAREYVFGALTLHSVAGTGTVALLLLHSFIRRVADRRWWRGSLVVVGALWMAGSAALWWAHYEAEHFAGFRADEAIDFFPTARMPGNADERAWAGDPESDWPRLPAEHLNGSMSCGEAGCHLQLTEEWAGSPHRFSADNALYRAAIGELVRARGPQDAVFCASCHDPVRSLAGTVVADYADGPPALGSEGVNCVVCHGMIEVDFDEDGSPPSNGRFTVAADEPYPGSPATMRRRIKLDPRRHRQAMVTNGITLTSIPCRVCHRVEIGPDLGAPHEMVLQNPRLIADDLYGEVDLGCGTCHLPQDEAATYTHRMAGIDVDLPAYAVGTSADDRIRLKRNAEAARDFTGLRSYQPIDSSDWPEAVPAPSTLEGIHRSAASSVIDLEVSVSRQGHRIELGVRTLNMSIGHQFPSGPFDLNQVWLEVRIADAAGNVLHHEGQLNEDGTIVGTPLRLGGRELRADGSEVPRHRIWEVVEVVDKQVLEGGLRRDQRAVDVAEDAVGPFEVRARWLFRRSNPQFARWALDGALLPPWELATAQVQVQ
jgi:hypothetical protein